MNAMDRRLHQSFGCPELAWLRRRLVQRLARGQPLTGQVQLQDPSARQRQAVDRLFGRSRRSTAGLVVPLDRLEAVLREAGLAPTLAEAVEAIEGPVANVRAWRDEEARAWRSLFETTRRILHDQPWAGPWLDDLEASGLLRRLAGGDLHEAQRLLEVASGILRMLPHAGITRAVLAALATGDSHALDPGRPASTLVGRAIRFLALTADAPARDAAEGEGEVGEAAPRRAKWEAAGVFDNDLTRAALVHHLPATGASLTDEVLRLHARYGEPCCLTQGQLTRHPPRIDADRIFVCENPAVLAVAARRLRDTCPPMICVGGQPGSAVHTVLGLAKDGGARLLFHGDFDWGGLRIGNAIISRYDARAWRLSAADYVASLGEATKPLEGERVEAAWDAGLAAAMAEHQRAVHEEMVIEHLLADLAAG